MENNRSQRISPLSHHATLPLALLGIGLATPAQPSPAQGSLEEVTVTAQRREENLRQVPISVVSLSAEALANGGVDSTMGPPELVPSVQVARSGPSATFFMRGVGNTSASRGYGALFWISNED